MGSLAAEALDDQRSDAQELAFELGLAADEALRGHRHGQRRDATGEVADGDRRRADPLGVLLEVECDASFGDPVELAEQLRAARDGGGGEALEARRAAGAVPARGRAGPGRPFRWPCSAAGRLAPTAETARSRWGVGDLVDEPHLIAIQDGAVDRLAELGREHLEEWAQLLAQLPASAPGQSHDLRTEPQRTAGESVASRKPS